VTETLSTRETPSLRDGDPSRAGPSVTEAQFLALALRRSRSKPRLPSSLDCLHLLRNDSGDPRRARVPEPLLAACATGTAIGRDRRRGARGEYTRGGIRQADAAGAWRGGRAARTANAFITAICVLP